VEYDSVLSQQSISGRIVSLISCVRKPGFFKSGHNPFAMSNWQVKLWQIYSESPNLPKFPPQRFPSIRYIHSSVKQLCSYQTRSINIIFDHAGMYCIELLRLSGYA